MFKSKNKSNSKSGSSGSNLGYHLQQVGTLQANLLAALYTPEPITAPPTDPAELKALDDMFVNYCNLLRSICFMSTLPENHLEDLKRIAFDKQIMSILKVTLTKSFPRRILVISLDCVNVMFMLQERLCDYSSGAMGNFVTIIENVVAFLDENSDVQNLHEEALGVLWNLSNIEVVRDELVRIGSINRLIEMLSLYIALPPFQVKCLSILNNICMTDAHRKVLADAGAVEWLIPLTHAGTEVRFKSCLLICSIAASTDPHVRDYVRSSQEALEQVIECVLSTNVAKLSSGIWNSLDIEHFISMSKVNITAVQCFAALCFANVVIGKRGTAMPPQDVVVELAQSAHPPTRALAIQVLSHMTTQLPREVLLPTNYKANTNALETAALKDAFRKFEELMLDTTARLKQVTPLQASNKEGFDVFISYRRNNGGQLASLIKVHLEKRGLNVFLDVDRLGAGLFDDTLITTIQNTPNFILLLTESALDKCIKDMEGKDWVRREIATAIKHERNILPIRDIGFTFPDVNELPEDIRPVIRHNTIEWLHSYQAACIDKIVGFLQRNHPN